MLHLQLKAIRTVGIEFGFAGGVVYYGLTCGAILLLAPMFFIVYIFRSERYYNKLIEYLLENFT
jgi:hypothetical protein